MTKEFAEVVMEDMCQECRYRPAEVYNLDNQYCADCWQDKTYPEI